MDTPFSTAVAAAAATIPPQNTPSSLLHIYTFLLKKKLVQNNEKQGRYDQKQFWSKKPKISPISPCKKCKQRGKCISLYSYPLTSYF